MQYFGNYLIQNKLQEKKYTEIYKAVHIKDQSSVIIKTIKGEFPSQQLITKLHSEYQILSQIDSEYVIKVYSIEKNGKRYGIIMEDTGGISLNEFFPGKIPLVEFYKIAIHIVNAIDTIHKNNIIHKDINPSNIIYNPITGKLKLIDFWASSTFNHINSSSENLNILEGNLAFISPEQTGRTNRSVDYRTDFYSLGITFYKLLTGKLPFDFSEPMELVHSHIARLAIAPSVLDNSIPIPVSDLIMKLISKTAEDRYISSFGLKYDLDILNSGITQYGYDFPNLGTKDFSDKFQIPQKLYGREKEINILLSNFDEILKSHVKKTNAFILISGFSGIGKSSLVAEINQPIKNKNGFFATGRFDRFQKHIPYSALLKAFRGLIQQLLTENEDTLQVWKFKLLKALDTKGQILIDAIPEIELIIGKQSLVSDLHTTESQNRLEYLFHNFIQVFCSKDHPLVIFLDNLQWADLMTLNLVKNILSDRNMNDLLLIGAYRDNEIDSTHPLTKLILELKKNPFIIKEIELTPLHLSQIEQIIADTLQSERTFVTPLAKLIETKTEGNPFFVNEFLKMLYAENLIYFEPHLLEEDNISPWKWDIKQIESKGITENVVELLVGNLRKLPDVCQDILQLASCIGMHFNLRTLSIISELPEIQISEDLLLPLKSGLVLPVTEINADLLITEYKFVHDRIRQAAYNLIDDFSKKFFHLRIGRLLLTNTPIESLEENIFSIVNQLNQSIEAIDNVTEKIKLAELNLLAGQKTRKNIAYAISIQYLNIGISLLPLNSWETHYQLTLTLYEEAAKIDYLNGNFDQMDKSIEIVQSNAKNQLDKIQVYEIKIQACIAQSKLREAVYMVLQTVATLGTPISEKSIEYQSKLLHSQISEKLARIPYSDLSRMTNMTDSRLLAIMRLLGSANVVAYTGIPELLELIVYHEIILSLENGISAVSALAFAYYGTILCGNVKTIPEGYQYGKVALEILEKFNDPQVKIKTIDIVYGMINGWKFHLKETLKPLYDNFQVGRNYGAYDSAGFSILKYFYYSFLIGTPLEQLEKEIGAYIVELTQLKQFTAVNNLERDRQAIINLIEGNDRPGIITGRVYNEMEKLHLYLQAGDHYGLLYFFLTKLILSFVFGDMELAFYSKSMVENNLAGITGLPIVATFYFYDSLVRLEIDSNLTKMEKSKNLQIINNNQDKMQVYADYSPMNYRHKLDLVKAEMARVTKDYLIAIEYYDLAISGAKQNGYINEEALANELAGKFYLNWGKKDFAKIYISNAHYAYSVWGAKYKALQLEKQYSKIFQSSISERPVIKDDLNKEKTLHIANPSLVGANLSLDFVSIMKASQIISGEIILEKLLTSLMKILVENAGAEKGFLLLEQNEQLSIEASWNSKYNEQGNSNIVISSDNELLSTSIVNYVNRTKQDLVIEDASKEENFKDSYIIKRNPKSILCIPLLNQAKVIGIVYLENDLTIGAFTKDRIEVLKMLSSQAAISIQNARLYSNLENVTKEKTKISTEMEIARNIQSSLIPNNPVLSDFEISTYMATAESVGGDYYDVIQTDGKEWFLIGDVSGHGITAGLIMMMVQTAIHTILNTEESNDPSVLLKKVNKVITSNIHKMKLSKYMTLTLFLKTDDGTIYYSGLHQDLLLYISSKMKVEVIETKGSWLGYYDLHNEYEVDKIKMTSGDVLLLFTDGITESFNKNNEMYGVEGLVKLLNESGNESVEEIRSRILESLMDYKTEDDVTFMVCKRKKSGNYL